MSKRQGTKFACSPGTTVMWIYLYIIMQRRTFKQIIEKTVIGVTTLATLTGLHGYFLNLKDKEQFQA